MMAEIDKVYDFAITWLNKFRDPNISYKKLVSHNFGDECSKLGFQIYCGYTFFEKYKDINKLESFKIILKDIKDIDFLGSAIYSKWSYFSTWAYDGSEILEKRNREWFIFALEHLANLSKDKPYGNIKKIKIISYKQYPKYHTLKAEDEFQQSLTLESDGHIWFSSYVFEKIKDGKYKKNRMNNFKIDASLIEKIISDISFYFKDIYLDTNKIKNPKWTMEIINDEGKIYKLCDQFFFYIDDLDCDTYISNKVRQTLKMSDLYLFDGKFETDIIDRIVVDYHRTTKINAKQPFDKKKKEFTWNYIEKLIVDRETKTIEHIQNIGLGCNISKKYTSEDGIDDLLDSLDVEYLFENKEEKSGNFVPIFKSFENRDYTISIILRSGEEKKISGSYDKKGLPNNWENFAQAVFDFITFYGCGEILNPAVYGKNYDDIILCSVKFKDGNKTYYYISDSDDIEVGDKVVVPIWDNNHETVVEVVKIEYIPEKDMTIPIEKIKHIIRKCKKD